MTANRKPMAKDWRDPDAAPDLSAPEWRARFDKVAVKRGRPKLARTKVSTTIRLDADVIEGFKTQGPGWQSRINATLRRALSRSKAG